MAETMVGLGLSGPTFASPLPLIITFIPSLPSLSPQSCCPVGCRGWAQPGGLCLPTSHSCSQTPGLESCPGACTAPAGFLCRAGAAPAGTNPGNKCQEVFALLTCQSKTGACSQSQAAQGDALLLAAVLAAGCSWASLPSQRVLRARSRAVPQKCSSSRRVPAADNRRCISRSVGDWAATRLSPVPQTMAVLSVHGPGSGSWLLCLENGNCSSGALMKRIPTCALSPNKRSSVKWNYSSNITVLRCRWS